MVSDYMDVTTINVTKETRKRLQRYGMKSETYDDLINRMLDKIDLYCIMRKENEDD